MVWANEEENPAGMSVTEYEFVGEFDEGWSAIQCSIVLMWERILVGSFYTKLTIDVLSLQLLALNLKVGGAVAAIDRLIVGVLCTSEG